MNPRVEEARIKWALRACETNRIKVWSAMDLVKYSLEKFRGQIAVAWSGGRCSTAVLHMALKIQPDIPVIWNNTGVEYPETVRYVRKLAREWNLNLIETRPRKSFWHYVRKYGFPQFRGRYPQNPRLPRWTKGKPACCYYLKEYPAKRAYMRYGIFAVLTGLRAGESRIRMFRLGSYGQIHYDKSMKIWKIHPIAFWSTQQLLDYIQKHNIPVNPLYAKGADRVGCLPCTGFLTWKKQLKRLNPRMYRLLMRMRGEPTLWEYTMGNEDRCVPSRLKKSTET